MSRSPFALWRGLFGGNRRLTDHPELEGALERFLVERGRDLDRWFLGARTLFALGLVGFLSIDAARGSSPTLLLISMLALYVLANVAAWTVVGLRSTAVRWIYMIVDVLSLLLVRHLFHIEVIVDPNATMVGFFTLLLLAYTIYGDPRLTAALAVAAFAAAAATVAIDVASVPYTVPQIAVYADEPFRVAVLLAYLAAFCGMTVGLSVRLRTYIVQHGIELLKRLEATMTTAVERTRREKIEELNRLKRDFISVLSHELRTPLAPLRSSLDLLARQQSPFGDSELLDIALESTSKLQRLVFDYTQLAELLTDSDMEVVHWNFELSTFMRALRDGSQCSITMKN